VLHGRTILPPFLPTVKPPFLPTVKRIGHAARVRISHLLGVLPHRLFIHSTGEDVSAFALTRTMATMATLAVRSGSLKRSVAGWIPLNHAA
jgi:hypothetical protein